MPYPNEHSARLRQPSDFKERPDWATKEGKFRRTADGTIFGHVKVPQTADVIWGQLKSQSGKEAFPQAIRFPIKDWTAAQARKWLKDNKVKYIRFEAAAPKKGNENILIDSQTTPPMAEELAAIGTNWILCMDFIATARQMVEEKKITMAEAMRITKKENPALFENFRQENAAFHHNSAVAKDEPDWAGVDKTKLPRAAFARQGKPNEKSTWGFPHHWIKGGSKTDKNGVYTDGTMYLHKGGLNAAWAAANGARGGQKAEQAVLSHLNAHRKAIGTGDEKKGGMGFIEAAKQLAGENRISITEAMRRIKKDQPELFINFRKNL